MTGVNLGSPAHVDAGKAILAERILYAAGTIGSVAPLRLSALSSRFLVAPRHSGFVVGTHSPRALGGAAAIGAGVR